MQPFVPKARRPKFDLTLKVIDLNNVPLVSGRSLVKWHIGNSPTAQHRGWTGKCYINDHKVTFDYEKRMQVRLTIDKSGYLDETTIYFEVIQEYSTAGRGESITLGHIKLNLAEYCDAGDGDGDEGVLRRYLMQESKINSTLKVGIHMKQIDGDRSYIAPPLKVAQVFSGIAGIMAGEQGDPEDSGSTPTLSSKSKEAGELQDMYRRTLAAYWSAQPGELRADESIEDIFAGGDGWGDRDKAYEYKVRDQYIYGDDSGSLSDSDSRPRSRHTRNGSGGPRKGIDLRHQSQETLVDKGHHRHHHRRASSGGVRGRGSLEQQANQMKAQVDRTRQKPSHEVDEFVAREDLRSWTLPS